MGNMALLLLAAIGIYGVIAYSVVQRTQEIGIRAALGATRRDLLFMVLRNGLWLIVAGLIFGGAAAMAMTRLIATLLSGVVASDPATLITVTAALIGIGVLACYLPARGATAIDPLTALRYE